MAYAKDFTYCGRNLLSVDPNLIVASFSSGSSFNYESDIINRTVSRSEITYDDALTYDYGAVDNSIYKIGITLMRKDGDAISQALARELVSWLIHPTEPQWLTFDRSGCAPEAMYDNVEFKGRFVHTTYEQSNGIPKYGITFEFENISPYGFTEQYEYTIPLTESETTATLAAKGTNVGKLFAPIIIINADGNGITEGIDYEVGSDPVSAEDGESLELEAASVSGMQMISIQNLDGNTAPFSLRVPVNTPIAIIGDNVYFYNGDTTFNTKDMPLYSFNNLYNFNWPRMQSGTINRFKITGSGTVVIVARYFEALGV